MAENENLQRAEEAYAAFGRGDIPAVLANMADDVEWVIAGPSHVPFFGTWTGKQTVQEWFGTLSQNIDYGAFEVKWFNAYADKVAVLVHQVGTFRHNGERFDDELAQISTYRDGKLVRFESYGDTAQTAAAYSSQ